MALYDVRVRVELELPYIIDAEDEDDASLQAEYMAFASYDPGDEDYVNIYTLVVAPADEDDVEDTSS